MINFIRPIVIVGINSTNGGCASETRGKNGKMNKTQKITSLSCACCGQGTRGRQYWNQDTGYGICSKCVDWITEKEKNNKYETGEEYIKRCYGVEGYNFNIQKYCQQESTR